MNKDKDQFAENVINVSAEGVHKINKEGVSKVDTNTGKGLFVPFRMTHKGTGNVLSGSHLSEEAFNDMVKKHSEKWNIERLN